MRGIVSTVLFAASCTAGMAAAQDCTVPLIMRGENDFTVEFLRVPANQTHTIQPGGTPALVAPALPVAAGMSGDFVRAAPPRLVRVRCAGGQVRVSVGAADGTEFRDLPVIPAENYARLGMRVHLTDHRRQGASFDIRDGVVERLTGPVLDMFQGRVPMADGDVAMTTEVRELIRPETNLRGDIALTALGQWPAVMVTLPGGQQARFVLDLGASRTVVARQLLAPGTALHELVAVEHSVAGTRTFSGSATGAGGAATGLSNLARLPWLDVGGMLVDSVQPIVMDRPLIAGRDTVLGILGLDVLRRAGRIRGRLAVPPAGSRLVLGGPPLVRGHDIPLRQIRGLLMVEGRAGASPILWLLDSGSRISTVPADVARQQGWVDPRTRTDSVRGIDGAPFATHPANVPAPRFGSWQAPAVRFLAADVPVVRALGLSVPAGLLGQSFFSAIGEIEIDFERELLRIPM